MSLKCGIQKKTQKFIFQGSYTSAITKFQEMFCFFSRTSVPCSTRQTNQLLELNADSQFTDFSKFTLRILSLLLPFWQGYLFIHIKNSPANLQILVPQTKILGHFQTMWPKSYFSITFPVLELWLSILHDFSMIPGRIQTLLIDRILLGKPKSGIVQWAWNELWMLENQ